jgi:hypothetical protein
VILTHRDTAGHCFPRPTATGARSRSTRATSPLTNTLVWITLRIVTAAFIPSLCHLPVFCYCLIWTQRGTSAAVGMKLRDRILLDQIAHSVRRAECNLFLGAGAHAPRPGGSLTTTAARPPSATELSRHLAHLSRLRQRYPQENLHDLARVSADFELLFGRSQLVQEVRSQVQTAKRPSQLLRILARLPFPLVLTTNYDTLMEDVLVTAGKSPYLRVYQNTLTVSERTEDFPILAEPSQDAPLVVKLHGDVRTQSSSIVITDEDRIQFALRLGDREPYHPIPRTALYYLARRPTLFLGYSLRDHNFRLLLKALRWRLDAGSVPALYVVDRAPDSLIAAVLQHADEGIRYIEQDLWRFVPALHRAVRSERHRFQ